MTTIWIMALGAAGGVLVGCALLVTLAVWLHGGQPLTLPNIYRAIYGPDSDSRDETV